MKKAGSLSYSKTDAILFAVIVFCSLFMLFVNFNDMASGKYLAAPESSQYQGVCLANAPYFYL